MLFHFFFILILIQTFSLCNQHVKGKALLSCTKGKTILRARFYHRAGKGKGASLRSLVLPMTDTAGAPSSSTSPALPPGTATVWHHYFFLLVTWFSGDEAQCGECHTAHQAVLRLFSVSPWNLKRKDLREMYAGHWPLFVQLTFSVGSKSDEPNS